MFGRCPVHRNTCKLSNACKLSNQSMDNSKENEIASRKFVAEKRLQHFGPNVNTSMFVRPKEGWMSSDKNRNLPSEFDPVKISKVKCEEGKLTTSNLVASKSSLGRSGAELNSSQRSLASYKIPKKNPASTTSSSTPTSTSTLTSNLTATKSKSTGSVNLKPCTKSRSPTKSSQSTISRRKVRFSDVPQESSEILHLLPREVRKIPLTKTEVSKVGTSGEPFNRDPCATASLTSPALTNTLNISNASTFETQAKPDLRFANKRPFMKVPRSSSASYPTSSTTRDFSSLKHKELSSTTKVASIGSNINRDPLKNLTTVPTVQTTHVDPSRPVAVVRPTKIDENNSGETSPDAEAAKRRKEVSSKAMSQSLKFTRRSPKY